MYVDCSDIKDIVRFPGESAYLSRLLLSKMKFGLNKHKESLKVAVYLFGGLFVLLLIITLGC